MNPVYRFYKVLLYPNDLERYKDDTSFDVIGQLVFNLFISIVIPIGLVSTGLFPSFNNALGQLAGDYLSLQQAAAFTLAISVVMFLLMMLGNFVSITLLGAARGGVHPFEVFKILVYGSIPLTVSRSIPSLPSLITYGLLGYSAYLVYKGLRQIEGMSRSTALYVFLGAQFLQILFAVSLLIVVALVA